MFFQKLFDVYLVLCGTACGVIALVTHELMPGLVAVFIAMAVNVCIVLELRYDVIYRGDRLQALTDESRRHYERPETTHIDRIAPIVTEWPKMVDQSVDEKYSDWVPVNHFASCTCVRCEDRRKSRYDEAEDE